MEPSYPLGTTRCIPQVKCPKNHIINPLLTKFVRSRWLDIGLILFCKFMDLDFVPVHKHAKKELGQYPAILTSHLVNNPYFQPFLLSCLKHIDFDYQKIASKCNQKASKCYLSYGRSRKLFLRILTAHSNSQATSCIERARRVLK